MVKGTNRLAEGYPTMPAAHGKTVATSVTTALGSITSDGGLSELNAAPMHATEMDNSSYIGAMTWAMIVGDDNIMMQRIGASNAALPVTSIAGMDASAVDKSATPVLTATGGDNDDGKWPDATAAGTATTADGTTPGTEYKGIPGAVWCLGGTAGCSVNAAGKLVGGWYFTPSSATELYVANPDMAGMYMVATMYARYGYWLTFDGNEAATTLTTVGAEGHSTTNTASLNLIRPATATKNVTAEYSGKAAGISARGDNSGHFTANVNLTATFGADVTNGDSKISGFITGFSPGAHTDSSWRVTLEDATLDAAAAGTGVAYGGAAAGAWTAQGYGPAPVDHDGDPGTTAQNQRPEGFFGTFNANFTGGGMAAGAYATRK